MMQEEGWVVCRAFKKPSPMTQNRQGLECWSSQAHFFSSRPQSVSSSFSSETLNQLLYPTNEGPSFSHNHHLFTSNQQFLSNDTVLDDHNNSHLVELIPQLHSPTTARAVKQHGYTNEECYTTQLERTSTTTTENNLNNDGQGINWKSLDNLFTSQFSDDTASPAYFSHPSMPLLPYASSSQGLPVLQPQNHQASHVLGCFPDS